MNYNEALREEDAKKDLSYFQVPRYEMLPYVPENASTILEVGCGCGNFGQVLKEKRSVKIWGVELNEAAAEVAAQKLDRVICSAFDSRLNLPPQWFDCVIFNDVLEHLVDPQPALIYAKQLLREEGVVVASIPNIRHFDIMWDLLVNKNWQYTETGILDKTHLRFFTRRSIISTFNDLGYSIDRIEGINPLEYINPMSLRKFRILNLLLFKQIEDMRYFQFAVVARPLSNNEEIKV